MGRSAAFGPIINWWAASRPINLSCLSVCNVAKGRKVAHHCVERPKSGIWWIYPIVVSKAQWGSSEYYTEARAAYHTSLSYLTLLWRPPCIIIWWFVRSIQRVSLNVLLSPIAHYIFISYCKTSHLLLVEHFKPRPRWDWKSCYITKNSFHKQA